MKKDKILSIRINSGLMKNRSIENLRMKSLEEIGATLKELRSTTVFTQIELSGIIGISQGELSKCESGLKLPSVQALLNYAVLFNVSMEEIIKREL